MTTNRLILFIIFLLIFYSCTSERKILGIMKTCRLPESSSLYKYNLTDSTKIISVNASKIAGIDSLPQIIRTKGFIVPLLFINIWNYQYKSKIGEINFINNIQKNIQDNLNEFIIKNDSLTQNSFYKINISIDSINSTIPYTNKGVLIYALLSYFMAYKDYAGPSELKITFDYKIEDKNHILKSGIITQSAILPPLRNRRLAFKNFIIEYYENYLDLFNILIRKSCEDINKELIK